MIHSFKTSKSYIQDELKQYRKPLFDGGIGISLMWIILSIWYGSYLFFIPLIFCILIIYYNYLKFKKNLLKSPRVKKGMTAQVDSSVKALTLSCDGVTLVVELLYVTKILKDKNSRCIIETSNVGRISMGGYDNQDKLNSLLSEIARKPIESV